MAPRQVSGIGSDRWRLWCAGGPMTATVQSETPPDLYYAVSADGFCRGRRAWRSPRHHQIDGAGCRL